jgi:hypothetical protein
MALALLVQGNMKLFSDMKTTAVILGFAMLLGGCQGLQAPRTATLDNTAFMAAWDAYRHCQAGTDVDAMRADARQLARISTPAARLSADPKAMAAACALSTGQAALRAERMDLATEMFQSVLRNQSQADYAFYADQARTGLTQVEHAAQFAGHAGGTPTVMTISVSAPRAGAAVLFED